MVSPVDQPDVEFVYARWEPLAPNGNIQTASARGEYSVTRLWTGLYTCASGHYSSESGQCEKCPVNRVTAILALGAIKGVCGRPWHMLGTLGT